MEGWEEKVFFSVPLILSSLTPQYHRHHGRGLELPTFRLSSVTQPREVPSAYRVHAEPQTHETAS